MWIVWVCRRGHDAGVRRVSCGGHHDHRECRELEGERRAQAAVSGDRSSAPTSRSSRRRASTSPKSSRCARSDVHDPRAMTFAFAASRGAGQNPGPGCTSRRRRGGNRVTLDKDGRKRLGKAAAGEARVLESAVIHKATRRYRGCRCGVGGQWGSGTRRLGQRHPRRHTARRKATIRR